MSDSETSQDERNRLWFGTCNNYTEEEYDKMLAMPNEGNTPRALYVLVSREICPTTGTPHLHCYLKLATNIYRRQLRNIHPRWNFVAVKGTFEECKQYITKSRPERVRGGITLPADPGFSDPSLQSPHEENGERPVNKPRGSKAGREKGGEANKRKWAETRAAATAGDLEAISDDHFVQYYGTLKKIACDFTKKPAKLPIPCRKINFIWIYGPPGTGKSHWAEEQLNNLVGEGNWYDKPPSTRWIGGDCGVTTPWRINDFDKFKSKELGGLLKTWAEESPFQGEQKGTVKWYRPSHIYVTCQVNKSELCFQILNTQLRWHHGKYGRMRLHYQLS